MRPTAYLTAKFSMTLCALGIADELAGQEWHRTPCGRAHWSPPPPCRMCWVMPAAMARARKPTVYADAAYVILNKPAKEFTGHTLLCEDVPLDAGVEDLSTYDCVEGTDLEVDLWVDSPNPVGYAST